MKIKQILVIRFSSLGDIILLTPLFREIKQRFPEAKIHFLTSTTFGEVCQNNPHIDRFLILDREKGAADLARIVNELKSTTYDLVLDAHRSLRSRLVLLKTFGFLFPFKKNFRWIDKRSGKRNLLLLTKINLMKNSISQREAYCRLLENLGDEKPFNTQTELYPGAAEIHRIGEIWQQYKLEGKPVVAIGPSASFKGKCWPQQRFLQLSGMLRQKGYSVVLMGGSRDLEPKWMVEYSSYKLIDLAGKLSYLESAEVLKRCVLTVSNDSAIVHFSEAMGTPVLAIFGPTVKEFGYGPFLVDSFLADVPLLCRPCSRNGKGKCGRRIDRKCLTDISAKWIYEKAIGIIQKREQVLKN